MIENYETGSVINQGSNYVTQEGWYHLLILRATDKPTKADGSPITSLLFQIEGRVLAGGAEHQVGKSCRLGFTCPSPSHKDGGEFAKRKIDNALVAFNVIDEHDVNTRTPIDVDTFVNQQVICHVKMSDDGKYCDVDGDQIYHLDDPKVQHIAKDESVLGAIPPERRKIGNRPKPVAPPKPPTPVEQAAANPVDLSDL